MANVTHRLATLRSLLTCFALLWSSSALCQAPSGWKDDLVEHLAGAWKMEGTVMGNVAHHDVEADYVLSHQFLRIQEKTSAEAPASERRYEATWYLGYDSTSKRYVMHLMDAFGARFSETLGYGNREKDQIRFVFDYPDGPFHTTFDWDREDGSWRWLMEQKDKDGKWVTFANLRLRRTVFRKRT